LVTPALGTPASGIMTNVTGTASGLTAGNVTTNANLTGNVTSVGNATTIASGVVTSDMIVDGTIVNGDINASAAIVDTKLATISTSGKVSNSATTATNANTASAIVARDASGNFSAGDVTFGNINVGSATGATTGQIRASGDIFAFASSDATLKTDVAVITDALAKVNSLRGVTYTWNEEANTLGLHGVDTGVIAQEVARVLPEVVTTRDSGHMAVKYDKMIGLLIEAIKELDAKVSKCTCNQ